MVDGDELAEPAREPVRLDRRRLVIALCTRPYDDFLMQTALFRWQQGNESVVQIGLLRFGEDLFRRALRDDLAVVHPGEPIEPARLVHVSGGDDHAHHGPTRADRIDQLPELTPRERIDTGGGLVENQQIRIVHQRAAEADFLLHAARELAAWSIRKWVEAGGFQKLVDACVPFGRALAEQPSEEVDVVEDAECGIEIAPKPLGHVGNPTIACPPMALLPHVSVEDVTVPLWILRTPDMSASKVDLPTPSGPINPAMHRAGISRVTSLSANLGRSGASPARS